jgi:hypothetical protein
VIVAQEPGCKAAAGEPVEVWGRAWSESNICSVKITADGGASWIEATLGGRQGRGWQRFTATFLPRSPGRYTLASCASDARQGAQPRQGKRNAWHSVEIEVF